MPLSIYWKFDKKGLQTQLAHDIYYITCNVVRFKVMLKKGVWLWSGKILQLRVATNKKLFTGQFKNIVAYLLVKFNFIHNHFATSHGRFRLNGCCH